MAAPTFGSVSPASGPVGGRNYVTITGTNFRLPTPPPLGPAGELKPTVRVRFNGEDAIAVYVTLSTEIGVEVPRYRGASTVDTFPPVNIEITNLDDTGAPIGGETVTAVGAYTYLRPALRAPNATLDLDRYRWITDGVVEMFRRNVLKATFLSNVSTDYGAPGTTVIQAAQLPNIALIGPRILSDAPHSTNRSREHLNSITGLYETILPPKTSVFEFSVVGSSDSKAEALAMMQAVDKMFMRHGYFRPEIVPSTAPTGEREQLPFAITSGPDLQPGPAGMNLHVFQATVQIRGIDLELEDPHKVADPVDTVQMQMANIVDPPALEIKEF